VPDRKFTQPLFALSFYALTAHFGTWGTGISSRARQWQVAAGLLYGQVKKTYRRRKVVRVERVMRWGRLRTCGQHSPNSV
jgi:hypothetical protein